MFLVEQGCYDCVKTNRLTLTRGTCNKQMGHLGKVKHKYFIGDGLTQCHRKFELCLLEFTAVYNTLHRHYLRTRIGHLYTDCTLAWYRSYDSNAQCRERESYVVLKVPDF